MARAAIQEDAHAVAITSYQGGAVEMFTHTSDILEDSGFDHVFLFGGGGGTQDQAGKASSIYVAVPLLFEAKLLTALNIQPYSPSISAVKVKPVSDSSIATTKQSGLGVESREGQSPVTRTGMGQSGGGMTMRQYRNSFPLEL